MAALKGDKALAELAQYSTYLPTRTSTGRASYRSAPHGSLAIFTVTDWY